MGRRSARLITMLAAAGFAAVVAACGDGVSEPPVTASEVVAPDTVGGSAPTTATADTRVVGTTAPADEGITLEEDRTIGPFPPQAVTAKRTSGGVVVEWIDPSSLLERFIVYRRTVDGGTWTPLGDVEAEPGTESFSFVDAEAAPASRYVYAVTAMDVHGNESEQAESAIVPAG